MPPSPVAEDSVVVCGSCLGAASIPQGWSMQPLWVNSQVTLQCGRHRVKGRRVLGLLPRDSLYLQSCCSTGAAGSVPEVMCVLCCQMEGRDGTSPSIMDVLTVLCKPSCSGIFTSLGWIQNITVDSSSKAAVLLCQRPSLFKAA